MIERAAEHGWEIVTSACGGCTAAVKGTEIHVEFGPGLRFTRASVREFLAPLLAREGLLTTRTEHEDQRHRLFVIRLGFRKTWSDDQYDYYAMTELPFGKE